MGQAVLEWTSLVLDSLAVSRFDHAQYLFITINENSEKKGFCDFDKLTD
jgi:hypothetical protein